MKKTILSIIALAAALILSAPAKAQYHGSEACNNSTLSNFGVLDALAGSGPNGEKVVRFSIDIHYTAKDSTSLRKELPNVMVGVMNEFAAEKGYKSRFIATDFNNPTDLNLTVYMDAYSTSEGYQIFSYVNGWSVGHLFQFRSVQSQDPSEAIIDAAAGFTSRIGTGWTCGTQK